MGDREASILSQIMSWDELQNKKEAVHAHRRAMENSASVVDQSFLNDASLGNVSFDTLSEDMASTRPRDLERACEHIDKLLSLSEQQKRRIEELTGTCKRQREEILAAAESRKETHTLQQMQAVEKQLKKLQADKEELQQNVEDMRQRAAKAELAHQSAEREWKKQNDLATEVNRKLNDALDESRSDRLEIEEKCRTLQGQIHELRAKNEQLLISAQAGLTGTTEQRKAHERRQETVEKELQMLRQSEMIILGKLRDQGAQLIRSRQEFQDMFNRNVHLEKENAHLLGSISTAEASLAKNHAELLQSIDHQSKAEIRSRAWGEKVSLAVFRLQEASWLLHSILQPWIWMTRRQTRFSGILAALSTSRKRTRRLHVLNSWRMEACSQKFYRYKLTQLVIRQEGRIVKATLRTWWHRTTHAASDRNFIQASSYRSSRKVLGAYWRRWRQELDNGAFVNRRLLRIVCTEFHRLQQKCVHHWHLVVQIRKKIQQIQAKQILQACRRRLLEKSFHAAFKSATFVFEHTGATVMAHRLSNRQVRILVISWRRKASGRRRSNKALALRTRTRCAAILLGWRHMIVREISRAQGLQHVTRKHEMKLLLSVFAALAKHVTLAKRMNHRLQHSVSKQSFGTLSLFFTTFADHAVRQKKLRKIAATLVAKLSHQSVLPAFSAWRTHFLEVKQIHRVALSVIGRWTGCSLPDVFTEWAQYLVRVKKCRTAVRRMAERRRLREGREALLTWHEHSHLLRRVQHILGSWMEKTARTVFTAWVQAHEHMQTERWLTVQNAFKTWKQAHKHIVLEKGLVLEAVKRMMSGSLNLAFGKWCDIVHQQKVIRKVLGHMHSMLLDKAWNRWNGEVQQTKSLKQAMTKWATTFVAIYFEHWRLIGHICHVARKALVATLRASVHKAFLRWEEHIVEEKHMRQKAKKIVERWMQGAVRDVFSRWHHDACLARKSRALQIKLLRRRSSTLFAVWNDEREHSRVCEIKHERHAKKTVSALLRRAFFSWHHQESAQDVSHLSVLSRVHRDARKRAFDEWRSHLAWKHSSRQRVRLILASELKKVQARADLSFHAWSDLVAGKAEKALRHQQMQRRRTLVAACDKWRVGMDARALIAETLRSRGRMRHLRLMLGVWKDGAEVMLGSHDKREWFRAKAERLRRSSFGAWASLVLQERKKIENRRKSGRRKSMEMAFSAIRAMTKLQQNVDVNVTSKWRKQAEHTRKRNGLNALKEMMENARLAAIDAEQFRAVWRVREDRELKLLVLDVFRELTGVEKGSAAQVKVEWDKLDRKGHLKWGFQCFALALASSRTILEIVEVKRKASERELLAVAFSGFTLTVLAETTVSTHAQDTWVLHMRRKTLSVSFSAMVQAVKDTEKRRRRAPLIRRMALLRRAFQSVRAAAHQSHSSGWQARCVAVMDRRRLRAWFIAWRKIQQRRARSPPQTVDAVVSSKLSQLLWKVFRDWLAVTDYLRSRTEGFHEIRRRRKVRTKDMVLRTWRWIHAARSQLNIRLNYLHVRCLRVNFKRPVFDAWNRKRLSSQRLSTSFYWLSRPRTISLIATAFDDWWYVVCKKAQTVNIVARITLRIRQSTLVTSLSRWLLRIDLRIQVERMERKHSQRTIAKAFARVRESVLVARARHERAGKYWTVIRMLDSRAAYRKLAASFSRMAEATLAGKLTGRAPLSQIPPRPTVDAGSVAARPGDRQRQIGQAMQAKQDADAQQSESGARVGEDIEEKLAECLPVARQPLTSVAQARPAEPAQDHLQTLKVQRPASAPKSSDVD